MRFLVEHAVISPLEGRRRILRLVVVASGGAAYERLLVLLVNSAPAAAAEKHFYDRRRPEVCDRVRPPCGLGGQGQRAGHHLAALEGRGGRRRARLSCQKAAEGVTLSQHVLRIMQV